MYNIVSKDGFEYNFDQSHCLACEGRCCIGESGYIWISEKEMNDIANFIQIDRLEFIDTYTRKVGYKRSLKELKIDGSYNCIFFDPDKKRCEIYPVRPSQCRTFPFWDYFKENINEVIKECPGIIKT